MVFGILTSKRLFNEFLYSDKTSVETPVTTSLSTFFAWSDTATDGFPMPIHPVIEQDFYYSTGLLVSISSY